MPPSNKFLTRYDRELSELAFMEFSVGDPILVVPDPAIGAAGGIPSRVEFQFPPKISSDDRKGSWDEKEVWGVAPMVIYKASESRTMSMKITYIVDGDWDYLAIKRNIKLIRGYYQRVKDREAGNAGEGDNRNLAVYIKLWAIGGDEPMSFRMRSCSVKYGETMIGSGDKAFPLKTEITLDIATWTQEANQALTALRPKLTPDWY